MPKSKNEFEKKDQVLRFGSPDGKRPVVWLKKCTYGYELYCYNPETDPKWFTFDTFEELMEWLIANPGLLLTKKELDADYLQLSFNGMDLRSEQEKKTDA